MSEHTPTPWTLDINVERTWSNGNVQTVAISTDDVLIAKYHTHFCEYPERDKENAANAAFIVKAVNSHKELVKALDGMVMVCGRTGDAFYDFEEQASAFQDETGWMRPGKSLPMEMSSGRDDDDEARREKYNAWVKAKVQAGRDALAALAIPSNDRGVKL